MKNVLRILFIAVFILGLTSCRSYRSVQAGLNKESFSLQYLKDSQITDKKIGINVHVNNISFDSQMMDSLSIVTTEKLTFIPAIFVYVWDVSFKCVQGQNMFLEDIPTFFRSSLIDEINRSANFESKVNEESDYILDISIDELNTEGPYKNNGYMIFTIFGAYKSYKDLAGPAISKLTISYKLTKEGELIKSNTIDSEQLTSMIQNKYSHPTLLQIDYAASMVEAVSNNFKLLIDQLIIEIEEELKENRANPRS